MQALKEVDKNGTKPILDQGGVTETPMESCKIFGEFYYDLEAIWVIWLLMEERSDISNRARILLARWSKLFVRSQSGRKIVSTSSAVHAQKGGLQGQHESSTKQRADELLRKETNTIIKRTKTGITEDPQEQRNKKLARTLASVDSPGQRRLLQSSAQMLNSSEAVVLNADACCVTALLPILHSILAVPRSGTLSIHIWGEE
eukprot:Gb_02137 [translate_table: standard]